MKFSTVMKAAALHTLQYPAAEDIDITLYDGKDQIETNENVRYVEPLFINNPQSFDDFLMFVCDVLDTEFILHMNVKIDEDEVVCFYKTENAVTFSRKPPSMGPIDYME